MAAVSGDLSHLIDQLRRVVGRPHCLADPAVRAVYSRDASHLTLGKPAIVVLPGSVDEVAEVVRLCVEHKVDIVARGAGTGLSGGAVPSEGAVVISLARLRGLGPVDLDNRLIPAEAGVINATVSRIASPHGLGYAPDPSSQHASTIGGNVAENAGGPHTLKDGVTVHHIARIRWCDTGGRIWTTGRGLPVERGFDLCGLLTGSEGCLGLVTQADLRLLPRREATTTLMAVYPELEDATWAVVGLLGAGLLPAAVEIVDRAVLAAVEAAFRFGFPTDVDAVMIVEFDGEPQAVQEDAARTEELLIQSGARQVRRAADAAEREKLWLCRKRAFGAIGRLTPSYVTMDVVVPLGRLPELVRAIGEIKQHFEVEVATAFHAGDGNLHPGVHFDDRDPGHVARAQRAADAITVKALEMGGSISGEHGIGLEKLHLIGDQLDEAAADLMAGIQQLFDPQGRCNPGKALPRRGEELREAPPTPQEIVFHWNSLSVSAPAEVPLAEIQVQALARGFWVPIGIVQFGHEGTGLGAAGTVGSLVDHLVAGPSLLGKGTVRDYLLELWAETSDGRRFRTGAPVFKNVAGFDLVRLLCGAGGILAQIQAATFQLKPVPESAALWHFEITGDGPSDESLVTLLELLRSWAGDLCAPVCLGSLFEVGARGVTIFAGGRDRPWDLDHKANLLASWADRAGLRLTAHDRTTFRNLPRLPAHPAVPAWARHNRDWTFLSRLPRQRSWPARLATSRWIWQASPPLLWLPRSRIEVPAGWHADTVFRAGEPTALPEPAIDVPRSILIGLKELFDPTGWLGEPDWFERAREAQS